MVQKLFGVKILINNEIKHFRVSTKQRFIEFNQEWFDKLEQKEIEFCVKWAKIAQRIKGVNITEIDKKAVQWFVNKYSKADFKRFLTKISDKNLYHRLSFSDFQIKKSLWAKIKGFLIKNK